MTSIYALHSLQDPYSIYIGKSVEPEKRLWSHLNYGPRKNERLGRWLKKHLALGEQVVMEMLDVVPDDEWADAEDFWIESFRMMGARLLNTQKGGQQRYRKNPDRMPEKTRMKISASLKGRRVGGPKPGGPTHEDRAKRAEKRAAILLELRLRAEAQRPKRGRPIGTMKKRPE